MMKSGHYLDCNLTEQTPQTTGFNMHTLCVINFGLSEDDWSVQNSPIRLKICRSFKGVNFCIFFCHCDIIAWKVFSF